jgi:hypothetical protein
MTKTKYSFAVAAVVMLVGCSGGSGGVSKYTIGGSIAGLTGAGLVLENNGGDDLTVAAGASSFVFATSVEKGKTYAVTVKTQPAGQTCTPANGSGTVGSADVTSVAVTCVASTHSVGGTVSGLAGTGLVLQNNAGDDRSITANGTFTFATKVASGAAYAVTVKTQPTSPSQTCTVTNGTGTMGSADVTVTVACSTNGYGVGGTVSGLTGTGLVLQDNAGDDLSVTASGTFSFATKLASGTAYAVTVKTQPTSPSQTCTVTSGTGTVTSADVTSVSVICSTHAYAVGGTVSGLTGTGLVLQDNGGDDLSVTANGAFAFATKVASGAPYAVTVKTQPTGQACVVAGGTGTVAAGDVTGVTVTCAKVVVQTWKSPPTWGGLWTSSSTMVEHAHFDGAKLVEDNTSISWAVQGGSAPTQKAFTGFPAGTRYGAGPFSGQYYAASGDAAVAALTTNIIVCAVVKPDYNAQAGQDKAIIARGLPNPPAVGAGWALTQTGSEFSFNYNYLAVTTGNSIHIRPFIPTFFSSELTGTNGQPDTVAVKPNTGSLPSYVAVCGGRDAAGLKAYVAVNNVQADYSQAAGHYGSDAMGIGLSTADPPLLDAGTNVLTIGGFASGGVPFGGRVYETAIWNEPGTPENIQAKLAAIQGLPLDGTRYARNREASFYGTDGVANTATGYHSTWRDGLRIDPSKGVLFGLQSWNRVGDYALINYSSGSTPTFIVLPGEDPGMVPIQGVVRDGVAPAGSATENPTPGWTASGGASVAATGGVIPPGDGETASSNLVTLPAGDALTTNIREFDAWGPIHGQIWLQVPSATTGKLRVVVGYSISGRSDVFDIDLSTLSPGQWLRLWLDNGTGAVSTGTGLWTNGNPSNVALMGHPGNPGPISFYVWGLQLTQVSTAAALLSTDAGYGGSVVSDLGAEMYDWSVRKDTVNDDPTVVVDALQLPPLAQSTATGGFCLSADLTPGANLAWNAPFTDDRVALTWVDDPVIPTTYTYLYVSGATVSPAASPKLCMKVGVAQPLCAAIPGSFTPGSKHTITGCMSAAGQMRLYADLAPTPLATGSGGATPDLNGGTILVGGKSVMTSIPGHPWDGYVSKALVCLDGVSGASVADCK